ncbi:P-selectin-like [Panonychus citri]|uniref:P-selectin-like n=1 Tax=Panonychus citri TaxID=50023 RepID=UPI0023072D7F|nr:P-selectin-like [Panonychus citri]
MDKLNCLTLLFVIIIGLSLFQPSDQYLCPPLYPPAYGYFIRSCGNTIGDNCNIDCEIGFDIVGPSYRVCRANGTWSGSETICVRPSIQCPMLRITSIGLSVQGCQNFAGGICSFSCSPGLMLVGETRIHCRTDGTWSGGIPTCRRISCPAPPLPPAHGSYNGGIGGCPSAIGSFCTYQCNSGYSLMGSPQIQCNSDGQWSGPAPTCALNSGTSNGRLSSVCSPLYPPGNGSIAGNCGPTVSIDDTCRFTCHSNFLLSGSSIVTCQSNGQWSSQPPRCIDSFCPPVNPSLSTSAIYASGQCNPGLPGSLCNFACPKGSTLVGSSQILCQSDGTWNTAVPSCRRPSCSNLSPPTNGQLSGSCSPGNFGESCTFFCNPGYSLIGSSKLTCESTGQWSTNPPSCILNGCPDLQVPLGGLFKPATSSASINCPGCPNSCSGQPGNICTLLCGRGFRLLSKNGGSTTMCNPSTMRWEPEPATCVRERYLPSSATSSLSSLSTQSSKSSITKSTNLKSP